MSPIRNTPVARPLKVPSDFIPPLESGDHLTRAEFERRYRAMPHVKKAELLGGVVYMASPVRLEAHAEPTAVLNTLLSVYRFQTPGTQVGDNATVRLNATTEIQPDGLLRIAPEAGGRTRTVDDYVEGGPELVVEVASSSASYDLHLKRQLYEQAGVQEYIVWRVLEGGLDWFYRDGDRFAPLLADADEITRSRVFPGFWLNRELLLAGRYDALIGVLFQGLADASHVAFVEKLQRAEARS